MKKLILSIVLAITAAAGWAQSSVTTPPAFIQSGTGAVTRTMEDKARESVSVRDFGALCNGVADDTAAIQKAINAAGRIHVPAGTCKVTGALSKTSSAGTPKHLHLYGDGSASVIAFTGGGSLTLTKSNFSTDFAIEKLAFTSDGNAASKVVFNVARGAIRDSYFSGFDTALEVNQAYQAIERNVFSGCRTGIKKGSSTYYNANTISRNLFSGGTVGISLEDTAAAGSVSSTVLTSISMVQNTFENVSGYGIKLAHANNVTIDTNYFEGVPVNIYAYNYTVNLDITNTLSHDGQTTVSMDNSSANISGGRNRNITLANGAILRFIGPSGAAIGTTTVDGTSSLLLFPGGTSWKAPTLGGTWANTGGHYATSGYFKDSAQTVFIQGVVNGGSVGSTIFTLPAGYRPTARIAFATGNVMTGAAAMIRIDPDGSVVHVSGVTSNISLSFSFKPQ